MGAVHIRRVNDDLKSRLRIRAAENGRSMEEEARTILRDALSDKGPPSHTLAQSIQDLFAPLGGVELEFPPRQPMRDPPTFE